MKSLIIMILTVFGMCIYHSSRAQAKIEVKATSQGTGSDFKGKAVLSIIEGSPSFSVVLYKRSPKPHIIKEIKATSNTQFSFDNLESDFYFLHVKDASGKLAISDPIEIREKAGKGGKQ